MPHRMELEQKEISQTETLEELMRNQHKYLQWLGNRVLAKDGDSFIPNIFVDEFTVGANTGTLLQLTTNFDTPIMIQSIITLFGGTSATLQIGDRIIPLSPNAPSISGIAMIVNKSNKIILTGQAIGPMFIEIMGRVMRGSEWNIT
jgi:hypothetical protein